MTLQPSYIRSFLIIALLLLLFSCSPTRRLKEGEYLLVENTILDHSTKLDKKEMEPFIKQKPNRKIFAVFRFHLWLYNLVNEDRLKRKQIERDNHVNRLNESRIARGKKPKTRKRKLVGEWLEEIGEPPVIYDSMYSKKSTAQLKLFLNSKGYFISSVKDSANLKHNKKAEVFYKIKAESPYTIAGLRYVIPDELVKYYVFSDTSHSLIKRGDNYDQDVLQKERDRITTQLNNEGYFLFTRDYIHYAVDTGTYKNKVNITLSIKNYSERYAANSDSLIEQPHQRFYIKNVYIQPDFISKKLDPVKKDTTQTGDYFILHNGDLRYKLKVLLDAIFIRKGELYQAQKASDTYKRLSELKAFKGINISFTRVATDQLDCYIQLSPILKQSFTIETQGKYTSGNWGAELSTVYQNRNVFRGAEVLELRLKSGAELQPTFNSDDSQNPIRKFNTVEVGPEANLYIPRFLLPFKIHSSKQSNPKTIFTSAYTYQHRPDYTRYLTNLSYGYTWKETEKKRHLINPIVINFVKVNLSEDFENHLNNEVKDQYIRNSFIDHLTTSTRYTFTFNEQDIKKLANFPFFRFNAESSGNVLRGIYGLVNSISPNTFEKDSFGRYSLAGIPYSQYLRTDIDYRYYFNSNEISKVVVRFAAGIGLPLMNFTSLPYERRFFSGGSNGIRAWRSRSLGPGGYQDSLLTGFDQFGDGQLEGNLEYRFKLFKMIHGAVFMDAGNNWLRKTDAAHKDAEFKLNRFYKEIAIGSGIGIRGDFSFFVLRLDIGIKVRDPQFTESERWVVRHWFDNKWKSTYEATHSSRKYNFTVFNIGIGYPF